jgi:hypothetical protein
LKRIVQTLSFVVVDSRQEKKKTSDVTGEVLRGEMRRGAGGWERESAKDQDANRTSNQPT